MKSQEESKRWAFGLVGGQAVAVWARFAKAERSDLVLGRC